MRIEFPVEEPSAEAALTNLVPKIVGRNVPFRIHPYQGKQDLLGKLTQRLRGYARWLPEDWRVVVLIDEDRKDCRALKRRLERSARDAGLHTKTTPGPRGRFRVLNRLAIEELEAWFFGDVEALVEAYPRVPPSLDKRASYRDPDAIRVHGGTYEALADVLKRARYYRSRMPKIETARRISENMVPDRNRSRSFQVFRDGLRHMAR
jgi:hypothetical protein